LTLLVAKYQALNSDELSPAHDEGKPGDVILMQFAGDGIRLLSLSTTTENFPFLQHLYAHPLPIFSVQITIGTIVSVDCPNSTPLPHGDVITCFAV
jgi:hypothetical protein